MYNGAPFYIMAHIIQVCPTLCCNPPPCVVLCSSCSTKSRTASNCSPARSGPATCSAAATCQIRITAGSTQAQNATQTQNATFKIHNRNGALVYGDLYQRPNAGPRHLGSHEVGLHLSGDSLLRLHGQPRARQVVNCVRYHSEKRKSVLLIETDGDQN